MGVEAHAVPPNQESRVEDLGKALRQFRKTRRMTQTELANAVGVAPAYVSQIESSLRVPSLRVARRIAEVLHVELPALFGSHPMEALSRERLSDVEKLELLRTLVRGVEQDLESRPLLEDVECYPGTRAARLCADGDVAVRSYAFTGVAAGSVMFAHEGEETVFCACGEAVVRVGTQERVLVAGDVFRFDSATPHGITGREGTILVSAASPPPAADRIRRTVGVAAGSDGGSPGAGTG